MGVGRLDAINDGQVTVSYLDPKIIKGDNHRTLVTDLHSEKIRPDGEYHSYGAKCGRFSEATECGDSGDSWAQGKGSQPLFLDEDSQPLLPGLPDIIETPKKGRKQPAGSNPRMSVPVPVTDLDLSKLQLPDFDSLETVESKRFDSLDSRESKAADRFPDVIEKGQELGEPFGTRDSMFFHLWNGKKIGSLGQLGRRLAPTNSSYEITMSPLTATVLAPGLLLAGILIGKLLPKWICSKVQRSQQPDSILPLYDQEASLDAPLHVP